MLISKTQKSGSNPDAMDEENSAALTCREGDEESSPRLSKMSPKEGIYWKKRGLLEDL